MLAAKEGTLKSFEEIDRQNGVVIFSCLDADGNPVGESISVRFSAQSSSSEKSEVTYHSLSLEYHTGKN